MAAARSITSPRRLFLSFLGLAPAAAAAAALPAVVSAPRSRDFDFLRLAAIFNDSETWGGDDWDEWRRLVALREETFRAMATYRVHTVEGVVVKAKIVAKGHAQVMCGHPSAEMANTLLEDLDRVLPQAATKAAA